MGKIFCIIGKSSTGKDTLYQRILGRHDLALRQIVSYTTRPIRAGEVDGIEYHFCTHEEKDRLLASGKVVEIRSYNTCHGIWDYFTVDDGNIDLSRYDYLVIGTIESFVKLRDYFSQDAVLPIYIEVEDKIRLLRASHREEEQEKPKYAELCRRFLADEQDFSKENLKKSGITKHFSNNDGLEDSVAAIKQEILRNIGEQKSRD